jgi:hypothetical protein
VTRTQLYFWVFLLLPVLLFLIRPIHVGDLSIWTALGKDSLNNLNIILEDPYTVTKTKEMTYPFGLCAVYGLIFKLSSLKFLAFLHSLIPCLWFLIWLDFFKRKNNLLNLKFQDIAIYDWRTLVLFGTALIGSTLILLARPALVATIPLMISYSLLLQSRNKILSWKDISIFCAIEIVWANIHGSFLLLPLMLGWQSLQHLRKKELSLFANRIITVVSVTICSLATPFGWNAFPYIFQTAKLSRARGLDEWFPPHYFYYPFSSVYFYITSAIAVVLLVRYLRKSSAKISYEILFDPIIPLWLSGFFAVRNIFIPFLLLPIFIFSHFDLIKLQPEITAAKHSKTINRAIVSLMFIAFIILTPFLKDYLPNSKGEAFSKDTHLPVIDAYLKTQSGSIFNDWIYGSDLALQQPNKYFIDARNIIFTDQVNAQYDHFFRDPQAGFQDLQKYDFKYFLIGDKHPQVKKWMEASGKFKIIINEGPATLYEVL